MSDEFSFSEFWFGCNEVNDCIYTGTGQSDANMGDETVILGWGRTCSVRLLWVEISTYMTF